MAGSGDYWSEKAVADASASGSTKLNLRARGLERLPTSIRNLHQLEELDLSNNQLTSLPDWLCELPNLRSLTLWSNSFEHVPHAVSGASRLERLDLGGNRLVQLPAALVGLANLSWLRVSCNAIQLVPDEIGTLANLRFLDLRKNKLSGLPLSLFDLNKLQELDVSENQIVALPDELGRLQSMRKLNLSSNGLDELPETLGELLLLEELNAQFNDLPRLPGSIGDLGRLKELYLRRNRLSVLPNEIGELYQLEHLIIAENGLRELPRTISGLRALKDLDASENAIEELPAGIGFCRQLERINLQANRIAHLPESIECLQHLTHLSLYKNELRQIPDEIGDLSQLTMLNLSHNKIEALPPSIGNLENLLYLHLDSNYIGELPPSLGNMRHLWSLDLSSNKLQRLPATIGHLSRLRHLDLSGNRLEDLPETLGDMESLTDLNLAGNQLVDLPITMTRVRWLKNLNVLHNPLAGPSTAIEMWLRELERQNDHETAMAPMFNISHRPGRIAVPGRQKNRSGSADAVASPESPARRERSRQRDVVEFAVVHPAVTGSRPFIVEAMAFRPKDRGMAKKYAEESEDEEASFRSGPSARVPRGTMLGFRLSVTDAKVEPALQRIHWNGDLSTAPFRVFPRPEAGGRLNGTLKVTLRGVTICEIPFEIALGRPAAAHPAMVIMRPIASAFISYARRDYFRVRPCVRGMHAVGVDVFMDVRSLLPGQKWRQQIEDKIDTAEKLMLFWSRYARASRWVEQEWRYGLASKGLEFIRPVPLADPTKVPPPRELSELHFGDPWNDRPPAVKGWLGQKMAAFASLFRMR